MHTEGGGSYKSKLRLLYFHPFPPILSSARSALGFFHYCACWSFWPAGLISMRIGGDKTDARHHVEAPPNVGPLLSLRALDVTPSLRVANANDEPIVALTLWRSGSSARSDARGDGRGVWPSVVAVIGETQTTPPLWSGNPHVERKERDG